MKLALGENDTDGAEEDWVTKGREREATRDRDSTRDRDEREEYLRDVRWQLFALLGERSTVKEALRTMP